jgi:hypothetical protein
MIWEHLSKFDNLYSILYNEVEFESAVIKTYPFMRTYGGLMVASPEHGLWNISGSLEG